MAVTPESRRWEELFAARTRNAAGDGIAVILGYLAQPDLISFAGGFPDPETFPAERTAAIMQELAGAGDAAAFQYAPTRGLAGTRDAIAGLHRFHAVADCLDNSRAFRSENRRHRQLAVGH